MAQQRALDTRAAAITAAARVFERHGYAEATIAQILEEAGITKGAMYFHFTSKEALAAAIVREQASWREADTGGREPLQVLVDTGYRFVNALRNDPLMRASIRLTLERNTFLAEDPSPYAEWIEAVAGLLREAAQEGHLLAGVDPDKVAYLIAASFTGIQLTSEAMTHRKDLGERLEQMWSLLLPSIVPTRVRRRLDIRPPSS